jgi:hypothetical protein
MAKWRRTLDRDLGSLMQQPGAFFSFTNTSNESCTLDGYPGFKLLDRSGKVIDMVVRRASSYQILDPGPRPVVLVPGGRAYFGFGWVDVNQPSGTAAGCVYVASAPPSHRAALSSSVLPRRSGRWCARSQADMSAR